MKSFSQKQRTDRGQGALIMVMSMALVMMVLGATLVTTTLSTDTTVETNLIQRYAYRALESGENAYMNVVNTYPNAVNCSSTSTNSNCQTIKYDTWIPVPDITTSNGATAESYLFGNPQPQINSSTGAVTSVQVQVVGVSGSNSSNRVYDSSIANIQPENDFLNNLWWSNFESFAYSPPAGQNGDYSNCKYDWQNSYAGPGGNCTIVSFSINDSLNGPVYSNDSIYVDNTGGLQSNHTSGVNQPSFSGGPVTTSDPNCLFVSNPGTTNGGPDDHSPTSSPGCQHAGSDYTATYDHVNSLYGNPVETPPISDSQLAAVAAAGGCLYSGPTTITMNGATMMVTSPDTPVNANGWDTNNNLVNHCYTNGTTATSIPSNGVVFVQSATAPGQANANPFDDSKADSYWANAQTLTSGCSGCYYGQSNTPDAEADVFVQGALSGQLTIGSQNDIIVDGNIIYQDCTSWGVGGHGVAQTSPCDYNATGTNDSLGLIAYNYVEVDHPVANGNPLGNLLPVCKLGVSLPPPLCLPADASKNITIDAAILALNQSFVVNNYTQGAPEGTLTVYGSMAQFARGPVGTFNSGGLVSGYTKGYTWDPRLALFSPPSYLQPGTPAWGLGSSASDLFTSCPQLPSPWVYGSTPTMSACPTPP
jgi:hypothetical protein